ncbi:MAG TPA: ROK family protein, partial [Pirellulales bacterium]|nr:ROK family protein [Pirellulales bacterium]
RETKLAAKKHGILNEIFRRGGCSRLELARRLNINATMVGGYVNEFLQQQLLVEEGTGSSTRGPVPVLLRPNPDQGCFLGIDFEALRARGVLCDFAGNVLHQKEQPFRSDISREQVLKQIIGLARQLADRATSPLLSVGVAAPGQLDCTAGRVLHYRLLKDFDQVPVAERFQEVFAAPVFIEDNIRAVAYAELLRGRGQGNRNFLCLAVRSGIGLGIVIDGKLYRGTDQMAGEVGYLVFPTADGPRLATELVSAKVFVESTVKLLRSRQATAARQRLLEREDEPTLADIVAAAEAGDEFLQSRLTQLGEQLGMIAANLANLFAPEKILLAGEVPNCASIVRQTMERTFRQYALGQILKTAYLEDAALGPFGGALGAAWQGFARLFPVDDETLIQRAGGNQQPRSARQEKQPRKQPGAA